MWNTIFKPPPSKKTISIPMTMRVYHINAHSFHVIEYLPKTVIIFFFNLIVSVIFF